MTITRADFLRLLPVAVGGADFTVEGDAIASREAAPAWRIDLEERPSRAFGPVSLPVLAVRITVPDPSASQAFLDRFHRGFQRAGG